VHVERSQFVRLLQSDSFLFLKGDYVEKITYLLVLAAICFAIMAVVTMATSNNTGNATKEVPVSPTPKPTVTETAKEDTTEFKETTTEAQAEETTTGMTPEQQKAYDDAQDRTAVKENKGDSGQNSEVNTEPDSSTEQTVTKDEIVSEDKPVTEAKQSETVKEQSETKLKCQTLADGQVLTFKGKRSYYVLKADSKGDVHLGSGNANLEFTIVPSKT